LCLLPTADVSSEGCVGDLTYRGFRWDFTSRLDGINKLIETIPINYKFSSL